MHEPDGHIHNIHKLQTGRISHVILDFGSGQVTADNWLFHMTQTKVSVSGVIKMEN